MAESEENVQRYTYLVRRGDTLEAISKYLGVPKTTVIATNPQVEASKLLTPGTFISLPSAKHPHELSLHAYVADLSGSGISWIDTARRELGVHELPGSPSNPRIIEYLHSVTTLQAPANDTDETPWCACFMQWVLAQVGIRGTNNAWALSYKDWGDQESMEQPRFGALAVFERTGGGHVGFFTKRIDSDHIMVLGGNESDAVSEKPFPTNGNGYKLVSCRWPKGF